MKRFTRHIEDFVCANCGANVSGNGYTNHCPKCLWSKHVDNNPGDRAATCGGLMRPAAAESAGDRYIITHKCEKCGKQIRQHTCDEDDTDAIIAISRENAFNFGHK